MPPKRYYALLLICFLLPAVGFAQQILNRTMDVDIRNKSLATALQLIGKKGNFTFSYISNSIPQDSLVTIIEKGKTVRQILDKLLDGNYQYKEYNNYLILQVKPPGQFFYVSGFVTDRETGQRISNATVYERHQLISTFTNNEGYYRLRLRDKYPAAAISVSKDLYADTSLLLPISNDQTVNVTISPYTRMLPTVEITGHTQVEKTWFGKLLLSSKLRQQSDNLRHFFADKPYQVSLIPGLGTHGRMGAQVANKFSLNVLGGYTAGVDGVELAGAFNIVKNDVHNVQVAGLLNITGGKMIGVQFAGLHNNVLDSMHGLQVAGISNNIIGSQKGVQVSGAIQRVEKNMTGVQAAGLISSTYGKVDGLQLSGACNFAMDSLYGAQVAGILNSAENVHGVQAAAGGNMSANMHGLQVGGVFNIAHNVEGTQVSTFFNRARYVKGVQIGFVNIADSTTGYMIGFINIVKRGYHKLSVSSTDLVPFNISWKSGSAKLYSILSGGMSLQDPGRSFVLGYGIGREMLMHPHYSVTAELSAQTYHQSGTSDEYQVYRASGAFLYKPGKGLAIFAGPVISTAVLDKTTKPELPVSPLPGKNYLGFGHGDTRLWLGWQLGVTIF